MIKYKNVGPRTLLQELYITQGPAPFFFFFCTSFLLVHQSLFLFHRSIRIKLAFTTTSHKQTIMSSNNTSAAASIVNGGQPELKHEKSSGFDSSSNSSNSQADNNQAPREQQSQENPDEDEGIPVSKLEWDSPEDPDNPKNWSKPYKWFVTMTVAWMCLVVTFGSSLYTAGIPKIMSEYNVSQVLALSGLSFYLVGLSLGPVLGAPMSEMLGRRLVYWISFPISMLFVMGVGLSSNIRSILVLRFFSGLFASPVMAIAGGSINDIWDLDMVGIAMSSFCLAPFAGPVLGPVIGGFAMEHLGWKWTMWIHLFFSGACIPFIALLPETYKSTILRKRALKRGIKIVLPFKSASEAIKVMAVISIVRPLEMLVREPIVIVLSFYSSLIFAILFGFFEAYPVIYHGIYHMNSGPSGLAFLGIGVGLLIAVTVYVYIDRKIFFPKNADGTRGHRDENGNMKLPAPEMFVIIAKIGAPLLPIALFWQAWTARESVHWMAPLAAGVPFGMSLMLIFFFTLLYFSFSYPPIILASVLAANNLARYILASVFPLFTVQMYEKLHVYWASSFFGFVALAMVPIPWIFEKYGPQLRKGSHFNKMAFKQAMAAKAAAEAAAAEKENGAVESSPV